MKVVVDSQLYNSTATHIHGRDLVLYCSSHFSISQQFTALLEHANTKPMQPDKILHSLPPTTISMDTTCFYSGQ
jgi:hypothetical protein